MSDYLLMDFDGRPITLGTKVRYFDQPEGPIGVVVDLGEFDGDHDDEGRSITIYPRITVQYGDGETETYPTTEWQGFYAYSQTGDEHDLSGKVEEVNVVDG